MADLTPWVESLRAGRVLEVACGTGRWTQRLARANRVVASDFAPEMLHCARAVAEGTVARPAFVRADAYALPFADEAFDAVLFGFWLSHVLPARLPGFVRDVSRVRRPGGAVWICDSRWPRTSGARDHDAPPAVDTGGMHTRTLNDGSVFAVSKQCFSTALLADALRAWGPRPETPQTREYFVWGRVRRPPG